MVAIKGMEIPKNCMDCPLFDGEYGDCNIIGGTKADATEERAENCPLVEIVTCKDCKHNNKNICDVDGSRVTDNFHCAGGERRE